MGKKNKSTHMDIRGEALMPHPWLQPFVVQWVESWLGAGREGGREGGREEKPRGGMKHWRKEEAELYSSSMKEAAVTLPGALGFYLSVVWKPISQALQLQKHLRCSLVCGCEMRARRPHSQKFSHNEKPVVAVGRWRAYTLCAPALSHLDLFTHIRGAPRPNDAPVVPSGVFTAKPSTSDQQAPKTRLMGVVCCFFFFFFFPQQSKFQMSVAYSSTRAFEDGGIVNGCIPCSALPLHLASTSSPPLSLPSFFSLLPHSPSPLGSRCHLSFTSLLLCIRAMFCCQLIWLLCQGAGHWLSLYLTSKVNLNVSINRAYFNHLFSLLKQKHYLPKCSKQCTFLILEVGCQFDVPKSPLMMEEFFCAWQQTEIIDGPISRLIKRSKGQTEVVKEAHSAYVPPVDQVWFSL